MQKFNMKTYTDHGDLIYFKTFGIPKNPSNRHYQQFLEELKNGEAELIPYTSPAPTWEQIRVKRNQLITETDWIAFPDVTHPNKQAWIDYRQALRDIPQNFTNPQDVIWPIKPE